MTSFATRPLLFGHRGASMDAPENTMPAFMQAIQQGAQALEMDVHVTSDGEVVVFHDDDGARMAHDPRRIRDCTLAQLRSFDLGRGFIAPDGSQPFVGRGLSPPRLLDVLAAFPGIPINIDVKPRDPHAASVVVRCVQDSGQAERVLLTSFFGDVVRAVRDAGHRGPTGLSGDEVRALVLLPLAWHRRRRQRGQRVQIPTHASILRLDHERFIRKAHALGLHVDYWVINDADEGKALLARGADGLMSDAPRLLSSLFAPHGLASARS